MMRLGFLVAITLVTLAGPAVARCNQPYAPVIKVKPNATQQDMAALHDDVSSFLKASDVYQSCLAAQNGDSALSDASQAEKERIGREYNTAVRTFKARHG